MLREYLRLRHARLYVNPTWIRHVDQLLERRTFVTVESADRDADEQSLRRNARELAVVEVEVEPALCHQNLVTTLLDNSSLIHRDNDIGVANRR